MSYENEQPADHYSAAGTEDAGFVLVFKIGRVNNVTLDCYLTFRARGSEKQEMFFDTEICFEGWETPLNRMFVGKRRDDQDVYLSFSFSFSRVCSF